MSKCSKCNTTHIITSAWNRPPCIYPTSDNVFQLPQFEKVFFSDVLCTCGNIIGIKVISGLKGEIGKWKIFQDKKQQEGQYKNIASSSLRKFIFEKSFKSNLYSSLQEQNQNKIMISAIQKLLKTFKKKENEK